MTVCSEKRHSISHHIRQNSSALKVVANISENMCRLNENEDNPYSYFI